MRHLLASFGLLLVFALPAAAQVTLRKGAVVFHGSSSNTSAPATIQEARVKESTTEWRRIQAEGIDPSSAQGKQLLAQMNQRIRDAVKAVAEGQSRDMVTRQDDIADTKGREVVDLTDKVISKVNE